MIINSCTAGLLHKWNFKGLKLLLYWVACHFRKLALHNYNPVSKEAQSSKCLCRSPNMTPPPLGWRFGMRFLCSYAVVVHYGPTETFTFTDIIDQHLHFGLICPIISCYCALFRCNFANLSCAERRLSSGSLSNKPHFFSPFLHLLSWTLIFKVTVFQCKLHIPVNWVVFLSLQIQEHNLSYTGLWKTSML